MQKPEISSACTTLILYMTRATRKSNSRSMTCSWQTRNANCNPRIHERTRFAKLCVEPLLMSGAGLGSCPPSFRLGDCSGGCDMSGSTFREGCLLLLDPSLLVNRTFHSSEQPLTCFP